MKTKSSSFLRSLFPSASILLALAGSASANIYQWDGGATTTNWQTGTNWNPDATIAPFNNAADVNKAHRLNVNGTQKLVHSAAEGTTSYTGDPTASTGGGRGLVIGSGTRGSGTLEITGGSFSTAGAGQDIIGNSDNNTGTLTVNGGIFIGSSSPGGTSMGAGGGANRVSNINVQAGSATVSTLLFNTATASVNLDGGSLSANTFTRTAGTITINLNGGTLKPRITSPTFLADLAATTVRVKSGGAIIDTAGDSLAGVDVTIGEPMLEDPLSTGGGLTKNSAGTLTLTGSHTYSGATVINAGTLALNPTTAYTYNNGISGAGNLAIGGAVTLGGANTYLGTTTVSSGGTLNLGGSLTSDVTVATGGNLGGEGSTTGALDFTGTSVLTFDTATPGALTAASIDATGAAVSVAPVGAAGSSIVVLQAAGGITGLIGSEFIGSSRVALSYNVGQTQLLANFTPAALTWKGDDVTNPTFWDSDVTTNWDNGGSPDKFLAGDNVLFDDTATSFTVNVQSIVLPGTVTFDHSIDYTVAGAAIGGAANIIKNGSGYLNLNNANTYTGATTITGGVLVAGNNAALGTTDGGTSVSGGGTLDINNKNLGTEVITLSGDGDGLGALVNNGAEQANAVGRLVLGADASIGGINRWDLRNSTPTLDMGGFTLTKYGANYIGLVGATVSNPGDIDVVEGAFSIQTSTNMGGSSANTLTVSNGAVLGSWQATNPIAWSVSLENGSTLRGESAAVATNNNWAGPVTIENTADVTINGIGTMTVSGAISGTDSNITKTGAGVAFFSGANSYTGLTTVSEGSWVVQNATALGGSTVGTTVASGARVEVDNLTVTDEDIVIAGNGGNFFGALQGRTGTSVWTGDVSVTADQTRIGAQTGASLEISGVISSATNHAVIYRPAAADATTAVILSGANTYPGPTWIVGGVVSVASLNSVTGGSPASNLGAPVTVADGTIQMSNGATGTLRYTGSGETTDRVINLAGTTFGVFIEQAGTGLLKFTSDLTATGIGNKTLVLSGSTEGTGELAGAIVNNDGTNITGLRKDGTGTWTVSGDNSFTGGVVINGGVLKITNSNGLGLGVKSVTINASANKWLELDGTGGAITLPADLSFFTSGVNGAIRNTAGDNVINGTFTMTIGNGNTRIISDNAGSLTLNGNISANTTTRVLDLAGDSIGNNAFNGVLSNASTPGLAKSGTGTWTLNGVNLYAGATTVNAGTLILGATGSIDASTSLVVAAGGELDTTAKASHALPVAVTIGMDGDTATSGLIDATGQELAIGAAAVTFNVTGTLSAPVYVLANYGTLSGGTFASATAPAGYELVYDHNGGTQIALVQLGGSPYEDWIDTFFTGETNPAIVGKDADPDNDGANNLFEFALNGNPASGSNNGLYASLVQDASLPVGEELTLIVAVRDGTTFGPAGSPVVQTGPKDGVVYSIQGTLDLLTIPGSAVSLASGPADTAPVAANLPDLTGTDWEYLTFKLDASEGLGDKGFLRIKVEEAP